MRKLNKILLIDDDQITNHIHKHLLEELNITHEIQALEDGDKALDFLVNCHGSVLEPCPELVIFDHQMPNMTGRELIEALHEMNFIQENDTVFMSLGINPNQKDVEILEELGVQEFAIKPLSKEKVMDVYNKYW
jgi:response regulator RpfG family c-di-GMP phosphodiesterase